MFSKEDLDKDPNLRHLAYKGLLVLGLTPKEIEDGPDKLSEERKQELKLFRKVG